MGLDLPSMLLVKISIYLRLWKGLVNEISAFYEFKKIYFVMNSIVFLLRNMINLFYKFKSVIYF